VVQEVAKWYPNSKIMAVGFSLGANLLVNYLGEEGEYTPLTAAASLCNPHNLASPPPPPDHCHRHTHHHVSVYSYSGPQLL